MRQRRICHALNPSRARRSKTDISFCLQEIKKFRTGLAWICNFDWVPIPIMYPQLVHLAVHAYFVVCVFARQYIISPMAENKTEVGNERRRLQIDLYFPVMSVLQFIFYMGWMKVAEAMLNPFGEDDDDFECNALIDRNIIVSCLFCIAIVPYNRIHNPLLESSIEIMLACTFRWVSPSSTRATTVLRSSRRTTSGTLRWNCSTRKPQPRVLARLSRAPFLVCSAFQSLRISFFLQISRIEERSRRCRAPTIWLENINRPCLEQISRNSHRVYEKCETQIHEAEVGQIFSF